MSSTQQETALFFECKDTIEAKNIITAFRNSRASKELSDIILQPFHNQIFIVKRLRLGVFTKPNKTDIEIIRSILTDRKAELEVFCDQVNA